VRRLSEGIRLGLLVPDEHLPSESDLAESFGVSPVTIREALTTLREEGLLVTRRGRGGGSFVRDVGGEASELLRDRLREVSPSELRDLAAHYVAISGTSALLAAYRAGEEEVALITATVSALERATRAAGRRRAESRFQVELAAAAQSPRLTRAAITLQSEVGPSVARHRRRGRPCRGAAPPPRDPRRCGRGDGTRARSHAAAHVYAALARAIALQLTLSAEDGDGRALGGTAAEERA
jgi:DNA-binding FadR family transcriptional regulator